MRGRFAGIAHGPQCGAARVATAIGWMILTENLFVRFWEDLGIKNDVGTIHGSKPENVTLCGWSGQWQISKRLGA